MKIVVTANGPYLVSGSVPLRVETIEANAEGDSLGYRDGRTFEAKEKYALCRCGLSQDKPFCDGTHAKAGFDGTETASRAPYAEQAESIEGPTLVLDDAEALCAFARFCDVAGTVWNLVEQSDDPAARAKTIEEAKLCPSGRLVVRDKATGEAFEPYYERSIALVEDPVKASSGPIFVRGGIEVFGADGAAYEQRNRVTLCRCGASQNKPFCDGTHADIGFSDGLAE
jgi:CDGSH-type Zn-finger protein